MDETEHGDLLASDAPDHETESLLTRVYLATLQHPEPSRSLLVAQGMPARSSTVRSLRWSTRGWSGCTPAASSRSCRQTSPCPRSP